MIKTQNTSIQSGRKLTPDIAIGRDEILIELKYDLKNLGDIYRLYYQAVRYSKIAKTQLIMLVHDPHRQLNEGEVKDLESIDKVKVIRIM